MTFGGIGPKLALICMPYITLSLVVMYRYPEFLNLEYFESSFLKITGLIWLATGIAFWSCYIYPDTSDLRVVKIISYGNRIVYEYF